MFIAKFSGAAPEEINEILAGDPFGWVNPSVRA
jgi:hypothetical protein